MRKGKGGKGKGKGTANGKGKGKGPRPTKASKSCPTADALLEMFLESFQVGGFKHNKLICYVLNCAGEICVMTKMGWISDDDDARLTLINETVQEDINSLPNQVAENLTGPEVGMCVAKIQEGAMKYVLIYVSIHGIHLRFGKTHFFFIFNPP